MAAIQGIDEGALSNPGFWKERQAEFEKYAAEYADLSAQWDAPNRTWFLWWGSAGAGINVPQECEDILKALATKAATGLPRSVMDREPEPWRLWLNFMRIRKWGFQVTGHTPCTELEWDSGVKDGKPLVDLRRQQKYTNGDEWKKVYRRTKRGKLQRLSARELKGKSSNDLQHYYHWLESGTIEHTFASSERLCEYLAARAFEFVSTSSERPSGGEGEPLTGSSIRPPAEKKRGRLTGGPNAHDCNNPADESIWISYSHDWRADAAFALECPAFLRPAKAARLDGIAILRKGAAEIVQHSQPQAPHELERCLLPELLKYAETVFDKMAEDKLNLHGPSGRAKAYGRWLRQKCLPAVINDVCRPIIGQFLITVRYVAEIVGDVRWPETTLRMRSVLWRMYSDEVIPGLFTRNLANRLSMTLMEERIPRWEARMSEATHPVTNQIKTEETATHKLRQHKASKKPRFDARAAWLKQQLHVRSWNKNDVKRHGGPDRKTVQKILDGEKVREDVLDTLAAALSNAAKSKNLPQVTLLDIPQD